MTAGWQHRKESVVPSRIYSVSAPHLRALKNVRLVAPQADHAHGSVLSFGFSAKRLPHRIVLMDGITHHQNDNVRGG